jgi:hypothetical protein
MANVIGHNESLSSPYHLQRIAALRNQAHGDRVRADMRSGSGAAASGDAPAKQRQQARAAWLTAPT